MGLVFPACATALPINPSKVRERNPLKNVVIQPTAYCAAICFRIVFSLWTESHSSQEHPFICVFR